MSHTLLETLVTSSSDNNSDNSSTALPSSLPPIPENSTSTPLPSKRPLRPPNNLALVALCSLLIVVILAVYIAWLLHRNRRRRQRAHQVTLWAGKKVVDVDHLEMGIAMGVGGEWIQQGPVDWNGSGDANARRRGADGSEGFYQADWMKSVGVDVRSPVLAAGKEFDPIGVLAEEQRKKRERRRRVPSVKEQDENGDDEDDEKKQEEAQQDASWLYARVSAATSALREEEQNDVYKSALSSRRNSAIGHHRAEIRSDTGNSMDNKAMNSDQNDRISLSLISSSRLGGVNSPDKKERFNEEVEEPDSCEKPPGSPLSGASSVGQRKRTKSSASSRISSLQNGETDSMDEEEYEVVYEEEEYEEEGSA